MLQRNINTSDPIALRYLMDNVIFSIGDSDAESTDVVQEERLKFAFYGKNRRNFLFLIQEEQYQWMSVEAMEAFNKTLTALKLSVDDIALLNVRTLSDIRQKEEIISSFRPKVMVFLGLAPQSVGIEVPPFKPLSNYNGIAVFCTNTFDEMLADGEKKKQFWVTIKTVLI